MARIRSIKPEFWTDEKIVECSPIARLLFVGMWNFCDDGGNHPVSVKTLKMEVFPGDDFSVDTISGFVDELLNQGLIAEYESEGRRYWHVMGWNHQKIDRPNKKYPEFDDHSTIIRRSFDDQTPEDVDVDVDVEKPILSSNDDGSAKKKKAKLTKEQCQLIADKYNEELGEYLPRVQMLTAKRESVINSRFHEMLNTEGANGKVRFSSLEDGVIWFSRLFAKVKLNPHWLGENDRQWRADFDWILSPSKFTQILEFVPPRGNK